MIKCFFQQTGLFFLGTLLFACSSTNNKPLLIGFSADSSAIVLTRIDLAGLRQLQASGSNDSTFKTLVSVLETPNEQDTAFQEKTLEGKFKITDTALVFIPIAPFVKGRDYLVITHLNTRFGDVKTLLKGDLKPGVQPQQKLLTR